MVDNIAPGIYRENRQDFIVFFPTRPNVIGRGQSTALLTCGPPNNRSMKHSTMCRTFMVSFCGYDDKIGGKYYSLIAG